MFFLTSHCPEQINDLMTAYGDAVTINDPVSLEHPYIKFTYIPNPPELTVRSILQKIRDISPEFQPEIVHPMTLEERSAAMTRHEQKRLAYRLAFTVLVAIPTFILGVVGMSLLPKSNSLRKYLDQPMWAGSVSRVTWAMFFLATPVFFFAADIFHTKAIKEIVSLWRGGVSWKRRLFKFGSMNLLMSLGTSVAYFASIALLGLAATDHKKSSMDQQGFTTNYFDSVVFLTMFLLIGRMLEAYSKARTASAVSMLGQLRPDTVHLLTDVDLSDSEHKKFGSEDVIVPFDLVEAGDYVRILPGMSPPADSIIAEGSSSFDEAALTGESKPVEHRQGEQIFAGTVNVGNSQVIARVVALDGMSMLDQIVDAVRQGALHRAPIERLADSLTGIFVPIVTMLAILTWLIWLILGVSGALPSSYLDIEIGGWPVWSLQFSIAVFVVACPCGIGLAAPTALFVGSGLAAKYGILARGGGEAFQEGANIDIICFDKTGTLTEGGEPRVTESRFIENVADKRSLLQISRDLELHSTHPLGIAVRDFAEQNPDEITTSVVSDVQEISGRGLLGIVALDNIEEAIIGNEKFIEDKGAIVSDEMKDELHSWKEQGYSVIILAIRKKEESLFRVGLLLAASDKVRPEAKSVILRLQSLGVQTWMITGDNEVTAKAVAAKVGIPLTNVIAGVLPQEKSEKVTWLQKTGNANTSINKESSGFLSNLTNSIKHMFSKPVSSRAVVAMVGDGINDAPSLTAADVGIAIGSGSDIALSSAKFVLVKSNLNSILVLLDLSRATFRRIKFNMMWALVYNLIGIPIAAGVIYPYKNSRLDPVWASLAMALSSISVISSSLLLKLHKPPKVDEAES